MSKHHSMRNWHIWISVILGFPLILVGITTFFIAHEDALGTKHVMMPAWLGASEDMKKIDVKSVATMGEHTLIGTKYGIFTVNAGQAAPWRNSVQDDVRDLMVQGQGLYVAGKMGTMPIPPCPPSRFIKAIAGSSINTAQPYKPPVKNLDSSAVSMGKHGRCSLLNLSMYNRLPHHSRHWPM
jgi:hypothetical protein